MALVFEPKIVGEGPPLIIQAPAWGPTSDYLVLTLAPMFAGRRVISYDPRNVGNGPPVDDPEAQAVGYLVDDLELVRQQVGVESFVLAGHSHGAYIAMAYAVRHPGRLDGLLLLNARVRGDDVSAAAEQVLRRFAEDPARRRAVELFRATGGRLRQATTDAELARLMRRLMPAYFHDLDAMRRFGELARGARPPSVAALQRLPDSREPWVEEGLPGVEVPTLALTGRDDVATTPDDSRRIGELMPRCRVEILERSGHHPWVEEPDRFRKLVDGYLASIDTDPGDSR